ncbi:MAG: hypothetical protein LBK73_08755 [Treponema sp.]|nr:hypothetical protein [Treponema sp.]
MKKLGLIGLLVLLTLPIFSQEKDSRAPFQGVWYDVNKKYAFFIFIDDIFICNLDYGFSSRYSVEDNNLILTNFRDFGIDGWENIDENATDKIQYVFSGDRLILVFDGEPIITLSRIPEW